MNKESGEGQIGDLGSPLGLLFVQRSPFFLHFSLGDAIASRKITGFFSSSGGQAGRQVATKGGGWGGNVLIAGFVLNIGLKCSTFNIHTLSPFESYHNLCQNLYSNCELEHNEDHSCINIPH